jgi:hypothetical protein
VCSTFSLEEPAILHTTGLGPQSVISADFNKDGHLDIALTNYNENTVSVMLGIGNGSFGVPPMTFPSNGSRPYWLVARDFNGDGNLDLAICNEGSNSVAVLLGLSNGSFELPAMTFNSDGSLPSSLTAVDVNNDNKIDLVVTNTGSNKITILLGMGNGTFQVPGRSYPAGKLPTSITNGDFNADGNMDLAVVSRDSNELLIFLGVGDGSFQSNVTSYTTGSFPYAVRTADLNGDSKLDLVVTNFYDNTISIFEGTGTGTFVTSSAATYATGGTRPIDVAIQDLNGDSKMDLVVCNQGGNSVTVYGGYGNGTFEQGNTYSTMGIKCQSVIVHDFNEDGKYDLAVTNQNTNTLAVLLTQCT